MNIIECKSDQEIIDTYSVMSQLRPHVVEENYLGLIGEMEGQGGRLIAAMDDGRVVGRALLAWIEQEAKAKFIKNIALDSGVQRGAAHKFYFREGFVVTSFNFKKGIV